MIPKNIHFIYFNSWKLQETPLSDIEIYCMLSAVKHNPDFDFYFHTNIPEEKLGILPKYFNIKKTEPKTEIFWNPITIVQHQSDVARLEILQKYWWIYLDTDMFIVKPLSPLLQKEFLCNEKSRSVTIWLAIIWAKKDSKFIEEWYNKYKNFEWYKYIWHKEYKKLKTKEEKQKHWVYYIKNSILDMMEILATKKHDVNIFKQQAFYKPGNFSMSVAQFITTYNDNSLNKSYWHHLWTFTQKSQYKNIGKYLEEWKEWYFLDKIREIKDYFNI